MHNVLCPAEMLEDSDYTELRKAVDSGDEGYYSDLQEDSQVLVATASYCVFSV
jgi:hypothetical protein